MDNKGTMKHFYQDIRGMMDYEDLYSEMVQKAQNGSTFVELGTWLGRSAVYMCTEIVNSGKDISFITIDNFAKCKPDSVIKHLFEFSFARVMAGDTAERADAFHDRSLDFVFVDADHSYKGVQRDIQAWLPKIRKGGVIAGHDYENWRYPELKQAVHDILPDARKTSKMCWIYDC